MSSEFNIRNFVNQLANDNTWTTSNLPKWASDQLSFIPNNQSSTAGVTSLRIDHDIQKIQEVILARPELLKHDSYCQNVQTVLQKLKLFRTQVFNSTHTQNSTNSNVSTTDSLEGLIHRVQEVWRNTQLRAEEVWAFSKLAEYRKQRSYWQSIFKEQLTSHILLIVDKKDPTEVLTLLVKAIECKDNQAIKDCLNFIEENNHQKSLIGIPALKDLFNNQEVNDNFSIVVVNNTNSNSNQNHRIYVNKTVLSAISPYFAFFFSSSWSTTGKESASQEMNVEGSYADIQALIQYFYTGNILLSADNVSFFLEQAHVWQLSNLTKLCETWLVDHLFPEDLFKFYEGNGHLLCTEGIVKSTVCKLRLRNLSADNYQEIFLWAKQMQDQEIQEKILQYLALRLLTSISVKSKQNSNSASDVKEMDYMALPSEMKEIEVQDFLRLNGHLLRNFDLRELAHVEVSIRQSLLQKIAELFPNLSSLQLMQWSNLTVPEMNELTKLGNLLSLQLYKISDFRALMLLDKLRQLQELTLYELCFGLDQSGVKEYHQEMINNHIANPDVAVADFAKTSLLALFSSGLPNLRKLDLTCRGINLILPALKHNPKLKELNLSFSDVNRDSYTFLAQASTLEKLDLSGCSFDGLFLDTYAESMAKSGQALKELKLQDYSSIYKLSPIKKFTKLEKLCLAGRIDDYSCLGEIPTLKKLWIKDSDPISKAKWCFMELHKKGILRGPVKVALLNGLSDNYKDHFLWAENTEDIDLQEEILQSLFAYLVSIKAENKNHEDKKSKEITQFLEEKGYILKNLELDTIQMGYLSSSERLEILKGVSYLFPNLSSLNLVESQRSLIVDEIFRIGWTQLTADEIKEIANLKNLTELHISNTDSLSSLEKLASLENLEVLTFIGQNFAKEGEINKPESLNTLFSKMPKLKQVDLSHCHQVDLVLSALKDHQFLQDLFLFESDLADESAHDLVKMPSLQKLDISSCYGITSRFLETLSSSEKVLDLRELDIRYSFKKELIPLGTFLKAFSNLKKVWLSGQKIEDVSQLLGLEEIPTLRELWINANDLIKGETFLRDLRGLQKLHVEGKINPGLIESIAKIPYLESLSLGFENNDILAIENLPSIYPLIHLNNLSIDEGSKLGSGLTF